MGRLFSRLLISLVALAVILIRTLRPDLKVDTTTLVLLGVAISPWLSKVIKGVEVPGGLKLEYRDEENRPVAASAQAGQPSLSASQQQIGKREAKTQYASGAFPDNYIERLVKLTPVEPIALFIVVSSLVQSTPSRAGVVLEWSIFGLLLFMTPFFFWRIGVPSRQGLAMMLAFCVWIFAIGGPFTTLNWYKPWYGGLVLAAFMSMLPLSKFD